MLLELCTSSTCNIFRFTQKDIVAKIFKDLYCCLWLTCNISQNKFIQYEYECTRISFFNFLYNYNYNLSVFKILF